MFKRIFLIVNTVTLCLFICFGLSSAYASTETDNEVLQSKGIAKIDSEEYDEAIAIFREILKSQPDDAGAMLMLGIAMSRRGLLTEAEKTLREVADRQYDLPRTYYELGIVYYKLGNYPDSRDYFKRAEQQSPEISLNSSMDDLVDDMDRREQTKRYTLQATVGLQYDTNVPMIATEDAPFIADQPWLFQTYPGSKVDSRAIFFLKGNAIISDSPILTTAGYSFYQSLHSSLSRFNVQNHEIELKASYSPVKRLILEARYIFDYTLLGGDDYSRINTIMPSATLMMIRNMPTTLVYAYTIKNFFELDDYKSNDLRSGFNNMFGLEQKIPLNNDFFLTLAYYYDNNKAEDELSTYRGNKFSISAYYNPVNIWAVGAKFEYYVRDYPLAIVSNGLWKLPVDRDEIMRTFNVYFIKPISPMVSVSLDQTFVVNSSANPSYSYNRSISGIYLIARF